MAQVWLTHIARLQNLRQRYFFIVRRRKEGDILARIWGVTPNLNIYITVNTDGYQHYGDTVKMYVYDDNTLFTMSSNYVDPEKLFDDIAYKLNSFVVDGWTHGNCATR